ncbi:butyrophilin subfamily 1 member A1-like isoform X6 [Dicentrarchus labrax]|uniref:butyrophilin subfamily 1 member A1-like isoform X6 n=1 Tax=Dicentrarchus labrax TaxID=13489 RepID=UPI0021F5089F|nr:butyrophilin subfamily 1 member A1-like isoform X6 [Dicentrarchus labrax]
MVHHRDSAGHLIGQTAAQRRCQRRDQSCSCVPVGRPAVSTLCVRDESCVQMKAVLPDSSVVWTRPGLDPKYIHVHQEGRLMHRIQNPSYYLRTRLFMDELQNGNVSMKIFKVKISDAGKYFCILRSMLKKASIQLTVGVVSTPIIEVVSNNSGRVVLQCESKGWYPEPEVVWLDGEGNLLSAGPTETVRGPDDLYTVSSRVTVEKRHSNIFTCRVQQKDINQTRETHIYVPGYKEL